MSDWYGKPIEEMENSHLHNSLRMMRERCATAMRYVALMQARSDTYGVDPYLAQRERTIRYFDAEVFDCDEKAVLLEAEVKRRDDLMNERRAESEAGKQDRAQRKMAPAEIDQHFDKQERGA